MTKGYADSKRIHIPSLGGYSFGRKVEAPRSPARTYPPIESFIQGIMIGIDRWVHACQHHQVTQMGKALQADEVKHCLQQQ